MSELLYSAQKYFPPKCAKCPFLFGLVEDGEISPEDDVSPADVIAVIREMAKEHNFEHCQGPIIVQASNGEDSTCTSFPNVDYGQPI